MVFTAHCNILCGYVGKLQLWNGLGEVSRWNIVGVGVGLYFDWNTLTDAGIRYKKITTVDQRGWNLKQGQHWRKLTTKPSAETAGQDTEVLEGTPMWPSPRGCWPCTLGSCCNVRSDSSKWRCLLENLRVGGKIILKWNLNRVEGRGSDRISGKQ